jgi:hypothetical protein
MTHIETKLGLTNPLKRLAYYFLKKGLGSFPLAHHAIYDRVDVEELYEWMPNPEDDRQHGGGIRVTFYRQGKRVRWVEFAIRDVGGGGDPAVFSI